MRQTTTNKNPFPALEAPAIPAWTVLPLRLFLGFSFFKAGWDKFSDPAYLDPSAQQYIGNQIKLMASGTPLEGFLTNIALPNANLFGVLVMGGELCIGLAVLIGMLTRFSAVMGLFINLTFFLSATWNVHPFYFGVDLAFVFLWLTLALTGPGPLAVDQWLATWLNPPPIVPVRPTPRPGKGRPAPPPPLPVPDTSTMMTRRAFLGAGGAGAVSFVLLAMGLGWGLVHPTRPQAAVPPAQPTPTPAPPPPVPPAATVAPNGQPAAATDTPAAAAQPTDTAAAAPPANQIAAPGALPVG